MKELLRSDYNYILYEDGERLLLSVVCGTVAVFDVTIELTAQEKKQFEKEGEPFISYLAGKVCYSPDDFFKRKI